MSWRKRTTPTGKPRTTVLTIPGTLDGRPVVTIVIGKERAILGADDVERFCQGMQNELQRARKIGGEV